MKIQINQKIWLEGVAGISGDEEEGESEIENEREIKTSGPLYSSSLSQSAQLSFRK